MNKTKHQQAVEAFMRKIPSQHVRDHPTDSIPGDERILSAKLLMEECLETIAGLGVEVIACGLPKLQPRVPVVKNALSFWVVNPQNIVEVIDGVADVHVIASGIASRYGVIEQPVIDIVDANNLEKFGPGSSIREDGKLVKPPGHRPPDIKGELARQLAEWETKQNVKP